MSPVPVPASPDRCRAGRPAPGMAATGSYRILGTSTDLRFPSQAVADVFNHVFSGFPAPAAPSPSACYDITSGPRPTAFEVYRDGRCTGRHSTLPDLVTRLERAILKDALATLPGPGLHAGAVSARDVTLLFPGGPGAGKTSLTLGLLLKGWALLSDEVAPVSPEGARILPFPRALWIKPDGAGLFPDIDREGTLSRPDVARPVGDCTCVTPTAFQTVIGPRTVTAVVFPRIRPGARGLLQPLPRSRGLAMLMDLSFNRNRFHDAGLGPLGDLVERADCFHLSSGSLQDSLEVIRQRWGDP